MISLKNNFVFIHIPKTGGNSFQLAAERYSDDSLRKTLFHHDLQDRFEVAGKITGHKHFTCEEYVSQLGLDQFMSLRKITFVRNPFDRVMSYYFSPHRWLVGSGFSAENVDYTLDKDEFLRFIEDVPTATSYLTVSGELIEFDFVGRFESFETDFRKALAFCGIDDDLPVPHANRGKGKKLSSYDADIANAVAERFAEDFVNFGYERHLEPTAECAR
jgi:hypothetical protein